MPKIKLTRLFLLSKNSNARKVYHREQIIATIISKLKRHFHQRVLFKKVFLPTNFNKYFKTLFENTKAKI